MRRTWTFLWSTLAFLGCGEDDAGGEGEGEIDAEETVALCTDGFDNDSDGYIDCFDHDCLPFQTDCAPVAFWDDVDDAAPPVAADFSCLHNNPPPVPPGGDVRVRFYSEDFESGDRVEGATIELFFENRIEGDPDVVLGPTDAEGWTEEVTVPAGTPVAARTLEIANELRRTVEFDILTPTEDGQDARALSVSDQTYRVVPAAVGVRVEGGLGIVAGQFKDCAGHDVAGLIATLEGQNPAIRYFLESLPAREPSVTTEDGLYVAINVEPGNQEVVVSGRIEEDGEVIEVGRREVQVLADSIDIVDLGPLAQ